MKTLSFLLLILFLSGFSCAERSAAPDIADPDATTKTSNLLRNLRKINQTGFIFGHQDATAYGVGWTHGETDTMQSDVKAVCGDFPALYGWDVGHIEMDSPYNLDSVPFDLMRQLIIEAYQRGGVNTISWHLNNPVNDQSSWDQTPGVKHIIPGGKDNQKYIQWLGKLAGFMKSLKTEDGTMVPVIFRPYHEWTGNWFWWGKKHCTPEEYIALWKMTVDTLTEKYNVHNLLYAFSPGNFETKEAFLARYPGNDYVDIIGFDYYDFRGQYEGFEFLEPFRRSMKLLQELGQDLDKVYAVTETGRGQGIPEKNWWTEVLYPEIENTGIAWVHFWRNYDTSHFFVPYPGHKSSDSFRELYGNPETLFESDLPDMYK